MRRLSRIGWALAWALALAAPALAEPDTVSQPVAIEGTLERRGVRGPAIGVEIVATTGAGEPLTSAISDAGGRFGLTVPPGPLVLRVDDPAFVPARRAIVARAEMSPLEPWGLDPRPGAPAAIRVYGRRPGAVTLDAEDLRTTAGTLGDPLRAVQSLPSVGTLLSIVPFPVVRGSAPGDTAIRVDGAAIPLLFHSGVGQGVVPSVLVEALTLHTGGAPVDVGRAVSAIDVTTAEPADPGVRGDVLLDLVQSAALVSAPLGDGHRVTVAGRIGYPGWVLALLDEPVVIEFADYHLRYAWRSGRRRARISLFGATDRFGDATPDAATGEPSLTEMAFHRLALRWFEPLGDATLEAALDVGLDRFDLPIYAEDDLYFFRSAAGARLSERAVQARLIADVPLTAWATLEAGIEQSFARIENHRPTATGEALIVDGTQDRVRTGAWLAAPLTLGPLRLTPGARLDLYTDPVRWAVDPRLDGRLGLGPRTALLGRLGLTHGPQRYPYPIPAVGEYAAESRLWRALHGQIGVEHDLGFGRLRVSAFARHTDDLKASALDPVRPTSGTPAYADYAYGDARAWGGEILLRVPTGGWIHGWLSYTVQRVERRLDDPRLGEGPWARSQLEQVHLLNGVVTLRLPGRWSVGGRLHYASGRPASVYRDERLAGYAQLDLRVEWRWIASVYEGSAWLDVINATHAAEPIRPGTAEADSGAFTLPMLGIRARF